MEVPTLDTGMVSPEGPWVEAGDNKELAFEGCVN